MSQPVRCADKNVQKIRQTEFLLLCFARATSEKDTEVTDIKWDESLIESREEKLDSKTHYTAHFTRITQIFWRFQKIEDFL